MKGITYFSRSARLQRAELRLADAEYHCARWVKPFPGASPREVHHAKQVIERAARRVERLRRLVGEPER